MALVEVSQVTVEYPSGGYTVRPLDAFDLVADAGELVVLLGPSGSGKTTLLSCLGGILSPISGRIVVDGSEVTALRGRALDDHRRSRIGFVFQAFNLIPSLTARENVAIPLLLAGIGARDAAARAEAMLGLVGLDDRAGHRPAQLSGGQMQRVAIARGLVHDPPVLLADEPTANLDHIQAEGVIRLLRELREQGRVMIVATHDDRLVPIADRVAEMVPSFRQDTGPPQRVEVTAGSHVFHQGDRGELIYVIEEGEIGIVRVRSDGSEEPLAVLAEGTYFGELGPLLGMPRSASARALTDTVLTAYGAREFREKILPGLRRPDAPL